MPKKATVHHRNCSCGKCYAKKISQRRPVETDQQNSNKEVDCTISPKRRVAGH